MNTKRLTLDAMFIAINVILCIVTPIRLANFKFTFEALPILIVGILLGPIDGFLVGTIGSAIYQILFSGYGLMITTPLWIIPHAVSGLIVGLYSKKNNYDLSYKKTIFITIVSALLVTILNTVAIYIDSKVFGYYTFAYVFGSIIFKFIAGIILAIIYSIIIPKLIKPFKYISRRNKMDNNVKDENLKNVTGGLNEQPSRDLDINPTESPTGTASESNILPPDIKPKR